MQYFRSTILALAFSLLIASLLPVRAWPQSGRGRPRVPVRDPSTVPPPPTIPEASTVVKQEQAGNTSRFILKNGLTVVISEHHSAPLAAAITCFKVGIRDEPAETPGIARLLQRIVLRGALEGPVTPSALDPRTLGNLIGADVGFDATYYYAIAPSTKIKQVLAFQAAMIQEPGLAPNQLQREVAALIEEDRCNGGVPRVCNFPSRSSDFFDPASYGLSRLAQFTLIEGAKAAFQKLDADKLGAITRERLADFYANLYRPSNLIVVVTGDVSTFATLVDVQQRYGSFGVRPTPESQTPSTGVESKSAGEGSKSAAETVHGSTNERRQPSKPQPAVQASPKLEAPEPAAARSEEPTLRYGSERSDISQSIVSVGFRVPGLNSRDWPALEVLSALMGLGCGSRLNRPLLDGQPVWSRAESGYLPFRDSALLTAQLWVDPGMLDKGESALFKELDRLRRELPGEAELARAKNLLEERSVSESATYEGWAFKLALAEAFGDYRAAADYRSRIRSVRAPDIQRIAAVYVTAANTSVFEYEAQSAPPRSFDSERFAATVAAWAPTFSKPVEPKQVLPPPDPATQSPLAVQGEERPAAEQAALESVEPLALKDFSTLNGPRAFVREDHSLPLVTVALLFQGGRDAETEATSGITELMLRSSLYGATGQTAPRIADELEQLGAQVDVLAEPDVFGFMLTVLSRNADRALRILNGIIEQPALRDEDISRARIAQVGAIREARDSSSERSRELLLQALYPGHPYAMPAHGLEAVVAKTTSDQLRAWHEATIKRQVPLAIIVGDTDGSALVSGHIAEGFKRRDLDRTLRLKVPQAAKPSDKAEQRVAPFTVAAIGTAGPRAEAKDLALLDLVESAFNASSWRSVDDPKNNVSFAYRASLSHEALLAGGVIYFQLQTSTPNEARARAAIFADLDGVARTGISPERLSVIAAYAAAARLNLLQVPAQRAMAYARAFIFREAPTEVDSFAERISRVTVEDIKRVVGSYFKPSEFSAGILRGAAQTK